MGKYFGTDGFRGEANKSLSVNQAFKIGRFLGWYYNEKPCFEHMAPDLEHPVQEFERPKFLIGKDTRRSSYMFEAALVAGITASGGDAYLLHVTSTPSVSYVIRTSDEFCCGIMITASHNPYYDNGIKLLNNAGEKMDEVVIDLVEAYLDGEMERLIPGAEDLPIAHGAAIGQTVDYVAGRFRYTGYLISLAIYSFKGLRVGLDCANGASWQIAKSVFDALGAKTYVINNDPNGLNINVNSGSTHIEVMQKFVIDNKLDVGFSYDGDADRCLAVDEKGEIVDGDRILYIYARYMKERGKLQNNTVVTTVMSNFGLYKAFEKLGIDYIKTDVGDKYVYQAMIEGHHRLGGEQSGHIIFSKYANTGDGILTSLKIMEVMRAKKMPLSKLHEELKIYPQTLVNVRVKSKPEAQNDPVVQAVVSQIKEELADSGRILVRESGTEPLIRVMVEAATKEICDRSVQAVVNTIKAQGHTQ